MQIEAVAQQFYQSTYIKGYSRKTISRSRHSIVLYCRVFKIAQVEDVSNQNLRNFFYYGMTERHWQASTFKCHHKCLTVFFKWCIKEGYLKENPIEGIEVPRLEKRLPRRLTKQEAGRLLEVVYNYPYKNSYLRFRNHALFSTFILAGLRKSELLNLKYTDIDIENMTILVRQGKGNKDRIIPISFTLADSLRKYLVERNRLNKTCPYFFCSLNRNMGIAETSIKRLVERMRKASGVFFTIHKLRHTFATLMLEGGCDIYSLSKMMGHSDISTTTIYLSASAEHLRSQMIKHPLNDLVQ